MSYISGLGSYRIDPSSIYQNHNRSVTAGNSGSSDEVASERVDRVSLVSEEEMEKRGFSSQSKSKNMNAYMNVKNLGCSFDSGSNVDIMA